MLSVTQTVKGLILSYVAVPKEAILYFVWWKLCRRTAAHHFHQHAVELSVSTSDGALPATSAYFYLKIIDIYLIMPVIFIVWCDPTLSWFL